jgi:ERCC4-type nuclease
MPKKEIIKFTVIRDTREKTGKGWFFSESAVCNGTQEETLHTGDYTIRGMANILCIERKGSVSEIAQNLWESRFYSELSRMINYKYKFIICEFDVEDLLKYPNISGIPARVKRQVKVRGALLLKKLIEIQLKYNVHILFCGKSSGKSVALSIMKRVYEQTNT